ncbi:4Fe-4S dicluster domain-containing protein [Mailhella massiliensis]|uniref:Formate dehydrogenase n=1 Tax=Mailhella massiliensis TaxID=1903261 RepID=A0A921ATS0_9BACT|nr:4Fe-4S dicluster domain-containing protein [Mailhella massiliensis]HJD96210.1 formate dehydrogenase [Mailhella massiliensis]
MPKTFLIDTTRCTACRGCQLACKEWHNLPANATKQRGSHQNPPDLNPNNLKIVRFHEHLDDKGNVVWNFFPDQCRHCLTPICVDMANLAVPGSMIQDKATGAVLVTEKCKELSAADIAAIIKACPYNIPRYNEQTKMLTKCDMCIDRVSAGLKPMCVKTCPTGAMVFGERAEVLEEAKARLAKVKERFPKARLVDTEEVNVVYLLAEEPKFYHEFASFG